MVRNVDDLVGRRPAHYDAGAAASGGLLAGLIGGAVVAAMVVAFDGARASDPLLTARAVAGALCRGAGATDGGPALLGLLAHVGLSASFGLAFGLVAFGWQQATVVWAGVVYGLAVYAFMTFIALPVARPSLVPSALSFFAALVHVAFGLSASLAFERLRFRSVAAAGEQHVGATTTIAPHRR